MIIAFAIGLALASASPLRVMIDPGHGGRDHGTVHGPLRESEITLSVSRRLYDLLAKDRTFRPHLTRDTDRHVSLAERSRLAKQMRADVFLSVHVNSNPDARARGGEIYFQNQLPPDEESMLLAHRENELENGGFITHSYDFVNSKGYVPEVAAILTDLLDGDRVLRSSQLCKAIKLSWRGNRKASRTILRQAPFFVLSQIQTPSALVELGFLTNDDDRRELTNPASQNKMAEDLYRGLIQYRESITNGHAPR